MIRWFKRGKNRIPEPLKGPQVKGPQAECPDCGSDDYGCDLDSIAWASPEVVSAPFTCNKCDCEWVEYYRFSSGEVIRWTD